MTISILTLFPEMVSEYFRHSMAARALDQGKLDVQTINIRDFSTDKHRRVDDTPFGGGAGMLMTPQPLFDAVAHVKIQHPQAQVIYLSPRGQTLNNQIARDMAAHDALIFVCGHYEGVDQRFIDECVDVELSIGDYVLTGGELPALVTVDAVMRFLPGVLGADNVHDEESFEGSLLEYPQYTRPSDYKGMKVPDVLLSGHHANIRKWQRHRQLEVTWERRPEILSKAHLTPEDIQFLRQMKQDKKKQSKRPK